MTKEVNNLAKMQDISDELTRSLEANAEIMEGLSLIANDGNTIKETTLSEMSQRLYKLKHQSAELTAILDSLE